MYDAFVSVVGLVGYMQFPVLMALSLLLASAGVLAAYRASPFAGIACALVIVGIHGGRYFNVLPDDPYITFRYSQHVAAGDGPVWNAGERVEGYTDFLWMLLLSVPALFGWSLVVSSQVLAFLSTAGIFLVLYLLAGVWSSPTERRTRELVAVIAALGLALSAPIAYWTFGGLETCMFAFFVLLGAYLHLYEEKRWPAFYWSAPVFLLAALTRPEGLLFFALTALFKLGGVLFTAREQRRYAPVATWLAAFTVPFAIYFAWRWSYYGYPFPNTFYDKVAFGRDQAQLGIDYIAGFGRSYGGFALLLVPLSFFLHDDKRQSGYLLTIIAVWLAYLVYVGGDFLRGFRVMMPIVPVLYFLLVDAAVRLFEMVRAARPGQRLLVPAALGLLLAAGAATLQPSQDFADYYRVNDRDLMADRAVIGRWLHGHAPANYTVAIAFAGAIPYYSQLPAIDMLGLTDKHIAHGPAKSRLQGHEKWDAPYVLSLHPEIIYPHLGFLQNHRWTENDYRTADPNTFVIGGVNEMVSNPQFWNEYRATGVEIRPGKWFNFFLRRDAPIRGVS